MVIRPANDPGGEIRVNVSEWDLCQKQWRTNFATPIGTLPFIDDWNISLLDGESKDLMGFRLCNFNNICNQGQVTLPVGVHRVN